VPVDADIDAPMACSPWSLPHTTPARLTFGVTAGQGLRTMRAMRRVVFASFCCAVLFAAEPEPEIYTLRDGRELTGVHDAQSGVIRIVEGRIRGEVPIKPGDIVSRRPVTVPAAEPLPAVTLVLRDGRRLSGRYDEAAGRLELLGPVSGSIAVAATEIAERLPCEITEAPPAPPAGSDAETTRRWWTDEIGRRLEAVRVGETALVAATDSVRQTRAELARVQRELAVHQQNRDTVSGRYRAAVAARQEWIDANPGAAVPEAQNAAVAAEETLLRELITASAGFATDEKNLHGHVADQAAQEELARHELAKARAYLDAGQAEAARSAPGEAARQ
jgi:hypothetical protein